MSDLLAYLLVFALAATPFFEMIAVIPLAMVWGLHMIPVAILAFLGNIITVILVILMMNQIKNWLQKRREKSGKEATSKRQTRAHAIWRKYGLFGLTFLAPLLIGSHLGAMMAMSFGGTKKQTSIYMTVSLLLWCFVTAIATYFGIELFTSSSFAV